MKISDQFEVGENEALEEVNERRGGYVVEKSVTVRVKVVFSM